MKLRISMNRVCSSGGTSSFDTSRIRCCQWDTHDFLTMKSRISLDRYLVRGGTISPNILKHAVTCEIASEYRGRMSVSQWIVHAQMVVPAALAHQKPIVASEISSISRGWTWVSHWIRTSCVMVSVALAYQNRPVASEIVSRARGWMSVSQWIEHA